MTTSLHKAFYNIPAEKWEEIGVELSTDTIVSYELEKTACQLKFRPNNTDVRIRSYYYKDGDDDKLYTRITNKNTGEILSKEVLVRCLENERLRFKYHHQSLPLR